MLFSGYNSQSIGVAFIGTFNEQNPNEKQISAGFALMNEGLKLGKLKQDYKIFAQRQLISTESPQRFMKQSKLGKDGQVKFQTVFDDQKLKFCWKIIMAELKFFIAFPLKASFLL